MIRGKKHIILTDIQCAANIQFYEDDYGDNTAVVDFTFVNMEDNIIIPKRFYVLTDECVEKYCLSGVEQINIISGTVEYYVESFYDLTDEGKEQYNLYCMTYNVGDKDDTWIDIDKFIEKYCIK